MNQYQVTIVTETGKLQQVHGLLAAKSSSVARRRAIKLLAIPGNRLFVTSVK